MQSSAKLSDHHDLVFGRHGDDVDAVGQVSDIEVMRLSALARSKPLATQPEQPVFGERLIVSTLGFADPGRLGNWIVVLIGHAFLVLSVRGFETRMSG